MISPRIKAVWLVIGMLVTIAPSPAQDTATVGDFTKSPTEHIIIRLERPFVVRSVKGIILRGQGDQEPLPGVLIEIQGPGSDRKIRRAKTDEHGRFTIGHVAGGTYKFKTTLNGFQSVMGVITVSKQATKQDEIKIEVLVGV
jgi:Carboxypeptidase regulatory-like domain